MSVEAPSVDEFREAIRNEWGWHESHAFDRMMSRARIEAQLEILHRLRWQSLHAGGLKDFTAMIDAAAREIGEQG